MEENKVNYCEGCIREKEVEPLACCYCEKGELNEKYEGELQEKWRKQTKKQS